MFEEFGGHFIDLTKVDAIRKHEFTTAFRHRVSQALIIVTISGKDYYEDYDNDIAARDARYDKLHNWLGA